jgi:hypothetical protein
VRWLRMGGVSNMTSRWKRDKKKRSQAERLREQTKKLFSLGDKHWARLESDTKAELMQAVKSMHKRNLTPDQYVAVELLEGREIPKVVQIYIQSNY